MPPATPFPDTVPELHNTQVYLRALNDSDVPAWFARATDAESADLAGDPIPQSIAEGAVWLQLHRDRFHQGKAIRWAIVPQGHTASIGTVGLSLASSDPSVAELAIVIGRAHWRQGLGSAAAQLVCHYAFASLALAGLKAEVLQRNRASVRLLEKAGFRLLQSVPGDPASGGDAEDCYLYGLPRPNPEPVATLDFDSHMGLIGYPCIFRRSEADAVAHLVHLIGQMGPGFTQGSDAWASTLDAWLDGTHDLGALSQFGARFNAGQWRTILREVATALRRMPQAAADA